MPFSFLLIAIILLSLATYFSFYLISASLKPNKLAKILIIVLLIVVNLFFMLTLSWSRSSENPLVHHSYIFFAVSLGFIFYLTIFGIIYRIINLLKIKISFLNNPTIFLFGALFFLLMGLYGAYFIKVKNISVNLEGLPSNWRGKKIVHVSDVHLGNIYGPRFLNRLIDKVNNLEADLVVITGDLFDGTDNRFKEFTPLFSNLKPNKATIFVMGNHDFYLDADLIEKTLQSSGIIVLRNQAISLDGLEIIGLDFPEPEEPFLIDNLDHKYKDGSRILLKHIPTKPSFIDGAKIDLQLSGHSHRGQMFPLSFLTKIIYGRYHYGLQKDGDYQINTSSGVGSWGPPLRAFNQSEIILITLK